MTYSVYIYTVGKCYFGGTYIYLYIPIYSPCEEHGHHRLGLLALLFGVDCDGATLTMVSSSALCRVAGQGGEGGVKWGFREKGDR